jgi:hypothetical protein
LHAFHPAHAYRTTATWLAALVGCFALLLATPAPSLASESNPNQYACIGQIEAGQREAGNEEQQVQYSFYCNGPISGYQLQSQIPVTGVSSPPTVGLLSTGASLTDTFSCSGEVPGWAVNCVGAAKAGYETITGQFAIGTKICVEPREDPLLTVTYAYLEKGVVTQAISGPFDLGRPKGCRADYLSGATRLNPAVKHRHKKHARRTGKAKTGPKKK